MADPSRLPPAASTKDDAQERADQIAAFRAELDQLAQEGISPLTAAQRATIAAHHDQVLARLASDFDVDLSSTEKQMSVGMRLAAFFGAATLTAAVVSFVYRVWGGIPTVGQVGLLTTAPLAALVAAIVAGRVEKTRYVSALFAVVACGAFVAQTLLLRQIFNLRDSPHVLGFWAAFAIGVAVPWRFALPFALGVAATACYAASLLFWAAGIPWTEFLDRPEPIMLVAVVLLPAAARLPRDVLAPSRAVLVALALFPLLVLSSTGSVSLLPLGPATVKVLYQVAAAVVACTTIAVGLRKAEDEIVLVGSVFAAVFLIIRFVDWWWDWMPKYLFFLLLAAVAIGWLWALRIARRHVAVRAS